MKLISGFVMDSVKILREDWESYRLLNIVFYGLFAVSVICACSFPSLHEWTHSQAIKMGEAGPLSGLYNLYFVHRNVSLAILATFWMNISKGAFMGISVPSLVISFFGFFPSGRIAINIRLVTGTQAITNPLTIGVMILEGQGYILAMYGVYSLWVRVIYPKKYNIESRRKGYLVGLGVLGRLYVLIIGVLFIAACYEVSITSGSPFPNVSYLNKHLRFSGANVKMPWSGSLRNFNLG